MVHDATLRLIVTDWTRPGSWQDREAIKSGFIRHYEHIRSIVPKDQLLEHSSRDGWEPICKFLGKPVPNEPYPRVNEGSSTWDMHRTRIMYKVYPFVLAKLFSPVLLILVAVGTARYMNKI